MINSRTVRTKGGSKGKDTQPVSEADESGLSARETGTLDASGTYESVIFIWFNPPERSNVNIVGPLRAINHNVQTFTESSACIQMIESSYEKIFFVSSVNSNDLIATIHDFPTVEAIFVLDPSASDVKGNFPKLFGIFTQHEELLRTVKEVFEAFEQVQLEEFSFEHDKVFLWSQLWKEEVPSIVLHLFLLSTDRITLYFSYYIVKGRPAKTSSSK